MKAISTIFSLLFLFAMAQTAMAQCTIPNPGFENWEDDEGDLVPVSWITSGERSNDAQQGQHAVFIQSQTLFGSIFPGSVFVEFPCTTRPAYLNFYIKTRQNVRDSMIVAVSLTDNDNVPKATGGGFNVVSRNNYTQVYVPLPSVGTGNPTKANIGFSTYGRDSQVKIDNVSFSSSPQGVALSNLNAIATKNLNSNQLKINVFPQPASGMASVQIDAKTAASGTLEVINLHGMVVKRLGNLTLLPGKNERSLPVDGLRAGMYMLRLATAQGFAMSKFQVK